MDAGEYEATPFYAAGADICTVLGVSGLATCKGVIKAANAHGAEAQIDLINVEDKVACARATAEAGAQIMGIHTGLDAQAAGHTPFADLNDIARLGLTSEFQLLAVLKHQPYKTLSELVQTLSLSALQSMALHHLLMLLVKSANWLTLYNYASATYHRQDFEHSCSDR